MQQLTCYYYQNLAPTYEQLADAYAHSSNVIIAKVDADAEKELAYVESFAFTFHKSSLDANLQESLRCKRIP